MLLNSTKMVVEIQGSHIISNKENENGCETSSGVTSSNLSPEDPSQNTENNKKDINAKTETINNSNTDEEFNLPPIFENLDLEQKRLLNRALKNFNYIDTSVYLGSARYEPKEEFMPCTCKIEIDKDGNRTCCDINSDCINRILLLECKKGVCAGGRFCKNQRLQRKEDAPKKLIETELKGFGLEATADYYQNQFVMEYVGEVISYNSFTKRAERYHQLGNKHFYFMSLKGDRIIDATTTGSLARFINHSCNPNCVLQKWMVGSKVRIGIFTKRAIAKGEELTFDYQFERYGADAQPCHCGESVCKGIIGGSKQTELKVFNFTEEGEMAIKFHGLKNEDECYQLANLMMRHKLSEKNINRASMLLEKIRLTDSERYLKTFLRLHGEVCLKSFVSLYSNEETIFNKILDVFDMLPIKNKNKLLELEIFGTLRENSSSMSDETKLKVDNLIAKFETLPLKYVIPRLSKLALVNDSDSQHDEVASPTPELKLLPKSAIQQSPQYTPLINQALLNKANSLTPGLSKNDSGFNSPDTTASTITNNIRKWEERLNQTALLRKSNLAKKDSNQKSPEEKTSQNECNSNQNDANTIQPKLNNTDSEVINPAVSVKPTSNHIGLSFPKTDTTSIQHNYAGETSSFNSQYGITQFVNTYQSNPIQNTPTSTTFVNNSTNTNSVNPDISFARTPLNYHPIENNGIYSQQTTTLPSDTSAINPNYVPPPIELNGLYNHPYMIYPPPNFALQNPAFIHPNGTNSMLAFQNRQGFPSNSPVPNLIYPVPNPGTDLLPGWHQAISPDGKAYYYHIISKQTTWERPTAQSINNNSKDDLNKEDTISYLPKQSEYNDQITGTTTTSSYKPEIFKSSSNSSMMKRKETEHIDSGKKIAKSERKLEAYEISSTNKLSKEVYSEEELKTKLKNTFAPEVVHYFNPYYKYFKKEFFKKHARRITDSLITKEMREECYKYGKMRLMDSSLRRKIKTFVVDYADKLVSKMKEHEKSK